MCRKDALLTSVGTGLNPNAPNFWCIEKRTLIKSIGIHKRFRVKKFGLKEHPRGETFRGRGELWFGGDPMIVRLTETRPHQRDGFLSLFLSQSTNA